MNTIQVLAVFAIVSMAIPSGLAYMWMRERDIARKDLAVLRAEHEEVLEYYHAVVFEAQQNLFALEDENQYLQETIAFWVEDRMTGSKWDNNRYLPADAEYLEDEVPF